MHEEENTVVTLKRMRGPGQPATIGIVVSQALFISDRYHKQEINQLPSFPTTQPFSPFYIYLIRLHDGKEDYYRY